MSRSRKKVFKRFILYSVFGITIGALLAFGIFFIPKIKPKQTLPSQIISVDKTIKIDDISNALKSSGYSNFSVSVSSSSGSIVGSLAEGTMVFFASDKDLNWQIASLQEIMKRLTIESRIPSTIDLRYSRPIVKF